MPITIKMQKLSILLLSLLCLSACYYDNQQDLYPSLREQNCEPGTASFSVDVLPVMNQNCNMAACHNSNDRAAGIVLDTYQDLLPVLNNGSLLGSIRYQPGYAPMPDGLPQLDPCAIQKIEAWVNAGQLDN